MKNIVITGANRGIGLGLAQSYAASGASVFGLSRNPADATGGVEWIRADVTKPETLQAAAQMVPAQVDLLVCNAGVYLDRDADAFSSHGSEWADTFAVNVEGVFRTVQAFDAKLAPNTKIAIISSQMGSSERAHGQSYVYRASKAAAVNLGRNLAVDLAPRGISVGIYHPGWVRTEMGTDAASIDVATSVAGLRARFTALSPATSGCFEGYDGSVMPF